MTATAIIGGGPAGAAAAVLLAQAGIETRLFEREKHARHKVCGEFLSAEAQAHIKALGLDLTPLGGQAIHRVRLLAGKKQAEAALPFVAIGLTRKTLDEALLAHAARAGALIERGLSVRQLEGNTLSTRVGDTEAGRILLATGKHELRGARRDVDGLDTNLIGFKQYFRLSPTNRRALSGMIEVVLFKGGYAGLQLVEGGMANLCLLVSRERFSALDKKWDALFDALLEEPHLARRLDNAEPILDRPLSISGVPYGFVHDPDEGPANVYRLGDQAGVIASFSGDGMSIALHSARLAAASIIGGRDAHHYHRQLRNDVHRQIRLAHQLQRAGLTGMGQRAILAILGVWPGVLTGLATATRVSGNALRRAGLEV